MKKLNRGWELLIFLGGLYRGYYRDPSLHSLPTTTTKFRELIAQVHRVTSTSSYTCARIERSPCSPKPYNLTPTLCKLSTMALYNRPPPPPHPPKKKKGPVILPPEQARKEWNRKSALLHQSRPPIIPQHIRPCLQPLGLLMHLHADACEL